MGIAMTIVLWLIAGLIHAAPVARILQLRPAPPAREIVVTIDDLPTASVLRRDLAVQERITADLLAALGRHHVPAIGFVNEEKLQADGHADPGRVALLERWLDAGLELGNHTFSHPDLHKTPLATFEREVLEGEKVTKALLRAGGKRPRYFRHPFLHTGRTLETRRALHAFLTRHGYRVAPVTIDNSDYVFAAAYDRAGARGDGEARDRIASTYVGYMEEVVAYYEQQSVALLGREVRQTLLIHASALNAAAFDALATRLEARGYRFVTLDRALLDPAYALADTYVGPGGISWLHRWALTQGKRGAFFAGEPAVPDWIQRAAEASR